MMPYDIAFVAQNFQFFQPMCNEVWLYGNDNPYENQNTALKQMCGGGMVNMTGTNLMGIMEAMKFAFHSALSKDLSNLEEMISRANFTYTMTSSDHVIPNYSCII